MALGLCVGHTKAHTLAHWSPDPDAGVGGVRWQNKEIHLRHEAQLAVFVTSSVGCCVGYELVPTSNFLNFIRSDEKNI